MSNCDNICDKQLDDSQYKWSIYNVFIKESDNHGFIYNSNTGGICRVPSLLYHDARENRFSGIQKVEALYKGGFIVDKGLDEFNALLNQSLTTAENRDHADIDVTIAPSLSCNMRCSYCFEKGTRHLLDASVMNNKTQDATINYILRLTERISAKNLNVIWFGGETLLQYPTIVRMSHEMARRLQSHVSLSTKLVTNGYLLSPEKITELVEGCNLKRVQISIDGLQDTYARIRSVNKDTFDRVVENIVLCSDTVQTLVRLNATPDNLDELYGFVAKLVAKTEKKSNLVFRLSEVLDYSNAQRRSPPGPW